MTARSRPVRRPATARRRPRGSGSRSCWCSWALRSLRPGSSRGGSPARAETEPIRRDRRQRTEMPHLPDSQHPDHNLELIAAYAAGDATGPELEHASALVASCDDCAALHHDLRSIAAAMPAMPAPTRSRDFRLTPEQAAELRPRGLRGLLATLSGPRFSFATPVGTGLAALGIVGVLVASGGLPVGSGGTAAPQRETVATQND